MTEKSISIPELENYIEKTLKLWNVPGAGVGVIKDGRLVSGRGYGVKEVGKTAKVNPSTNFAIGSNTKAFTVACIGMLVEEGKLAWDDKVTRYLPTFALYDPWVTKEVTIRDLLCHRIGISDVERFLYNSTCSNAEVVHRLRYVQPSSPFRADFQYSNISFMAAGEILRVVTGQTWEKMVKERIFQPLGMNSSTTNFNDVKSSSNAAMPHVNPYHGLLSIHARM
jgi:CubicO group peptidase (beta-lactamase class C family)